MTTEILKLVATICALQTPQKEMHVNRVACQLYYRECISKRINQVSYIDVEIMKALNRCAEIDLSVQIKHANK